MEIKIRRFEWPLSVKLSVTRGALSTWESKKANSYQFLESDKLKGTHMKRRMWWAVLLALGWVSGVEAGSISTLLNQAIPDGDPAGLASTIHISGESGWANSLQVDLNISGTYNGDLYAYLVHDGGFSVLLNRVGRTSNNDLGYGDGGLNVTFADGAANGDIHNYRTTLFGNASTTLSGPLTGIWSPDGRQGSPFGVTDADARSALLSSFDGLDPNGDWTLFVADLSGGDLHQLNSWGLEVNAPIAAVPESGNAALLLMLGLAVVLLAARCRKGHLSLRRATVPMKRSYFARRGGQLGLMIAMSCLGRESFGQGGRVTGFGGQVVYPLNGYGARITKVTAGGNHNLALTIDGLIVAWGDNGSGQSTVADGLGKVMALAATDQASFAVKENGTIAAWGTDDVVQSDVLSRFTGVVDVAATVEHGLVLKSDGTVAAWGHNETGQCDVPPGLSDVQAIGAGGELTFLRHSQVLIRGHSVALKADKTVVAWGDNSLGQCNVPAGLSGVAAIAVGQHHNLALKMDGTVVAWGANGAGQCNVPNWLTGVLAVAAGQSHSLALKGDGTVVAWGDNTFSQCDVPGSLSGVIAIAGGGMHSLALRSDGTGAGWGNASYGQATTPAGISGILSVAAGGYNAFALTRNGTVFSWDPVQTGFPSTLDNVVAIAAGNTHSLALKGDGTVVAGGFYNGVGAAEVPGGLDDVIAVSGAEGGDHSLALKRDGTVVAWGLNNWHQCDVPAGLGEVVAVAAGGYTSLALKIDGTVAAWGDNSRGQCDVPSGLNRVVAIAAGSTFCLALTGNGTVAAWGTGSGYYGETQLPVGLQDVVAIAAGVTHALALKRDGTVVAWGNPEQTVVPSHLSNVVAIAAGNFSVVVVGGTNRSPIAGTYELATSRNTAKPMSLFNLHQVCTDPDWDTFIITEVSATSAAGGTARITGSTVIYTPPPGYVGSDSFTYTVRDSRGGISQGTVHVTIPAGSGQGGSVTGWGTPVVYPLGGRGAHVTQVTAGDSYNLALKSDGTLVAWGMNYQGQCNIPSGLTDIVSISAGVGHNLVLRGDGTVVAWGDNFYGQCNVPSGLSNVVAITAKYDQSLALRRDGTVIGWGWNDYGQVNVPSDLNGVVAIAAGNYHSLALKADGTVVAWGNNSSGQTDVPSGLNGVVAISAGAEHSVALKKDGSVVAWGNNFRGQCDVPPGLSGVVAIAVGGGHSLAVRTDGTVVAWGENFSKECDVPVGLSGVVGISAGSIHSLALKADGTIVAWGGNDTGQCTELTGLSGVTAIAAGGNYNLALKADRSVVAWGSFGFFNDFNVPNGLSGVAAISVGDAHSLALKLDGTVVAWGNNYYGQCDTPGFLSGVVAVDGGGFHSLALTGDGTVVAWGRNFSGECNVPNGLSEVVAISAGGGGFSGDPPPGGPQADHSLALKVDGSVVAWGDNSWGQTNVPHGLSGVVAISAGGYHSLALKVDGTVVAWGNNTWSQCEVPSGLREVVAIAAGLSHSMALKADGTVIVWGREPWEPPSCIECAPLNGLSGVVAIAAGWDSNLALFDTVNQPPIPGIYQMKVSRNEGSQVPLFKLHRACSDPDWDSFIITGVNPNTAAGGTAQINGSTVLYTPPLDFVGSDSFTYTVRDCRGADSQGTVYVTVTASTGSGPNVIGVSVASDGSATVRFAGIPEVSYIIEASIDLVHWDSIGSATAGTNGLFEFVDTQAGNYTSRYYRTRHAP